MSIKSYKTVFITGANRGLGFEMVKQILRKYNPDVVFATYRDISRAKELFTLASENPTVHPILMDVKDPTTFPPVVEEVAKITGERGLHLLINNAGFFSFDSESSQSLQGITKKTMLEFLEINTFGAIFVTQAFLPLLEKGGNVCSLNSPIGLGRAAIVNLSSRLGSMTDNKSGGFYASRCTRAALNAATKSMSIDLKDRNILVVAVNPGWVSTDQGGPNAPITPENSVCGILKVVDSLDDEMSGGFMQYDGKIIPW